MQTGRGRRLAPLGRSRTAGEDAAVSRNSPEPPNVKCPVCGKPVPTQASACPDCTPGQEEDELRPLGGPPPRQIPKPSLPPPAPRPADTEPLPPAPGQEPFGTLANIKAIVRADPIFGCLLFLMALNVLANALSGSVLGILISAAMLWGVLTFQWWGYLIAMVSVGLSLFGNVVSLVRLLARSATFGGLAWVLLFLAIDVFVLIVLYTRRQHFD